MEGKQYFRSGHGDYSCTVHIRAFTAADFLTIWKHADRFFILDLSLTIDIAEEGAAEEVGAALDRLPFGIGSSIS